MVVAAMQGVDKHIRVQYLAKRHLDMQNRGIEPATFQQQDTGSTPNPPLSPQKSLSIIMIFSSLLVDITTITLCITQPLMCLYFLIIQSGEYYYLIQFTAGEVGCKDTGNWEGKGLLHNSKCIQNYSTALQPTPSLVIQEL